VNKVNLSQRATFRRIRALGRLKPMTKGKVSIRVSLTDGSEDVTVIQAPRSNAEHISTLNDRINQGKRP
jgi:hypothetical protein